ncbi:MAG: hypothetical protein JSV55_04750 [Deltaproteobacteria bacterium]|nr:MAG: hypothetical protein JSV55_04750 [Deltaproteobacteria bacterium]
MRLRDKRQVLAVLAGIPLLGLAFLSSGCGNGGGGTDAFTIVSSISVDGGANEADEARGIALDEDGNLYATGYVTMNGNRNIWLAKYDANLILQESIVVDGPANGEDVGYVIALDGRGYVYVVGYMTETGEGHNIWLAKYDTDLILQKQITVNGSANDTDEGYGILFDGSGTLYVTGTLTEPGEGYNIWIAKYDMDLNPLESVTLNGPVDGEDTAYTIALDATGNLYQTGVYTEATGGSNIWVARYSTDLSLQSYTTVNGSADGYDTGLGIIRGIGQDLYVSASIDEVAGGVNIWLARYKVWP